ncbi:MAG: 4-(cytidine 5'-diphospho)-2-C-methyl-D-erythritol kinase [Nitrospiria bacterium]
MQDKIPLHSTKNAFTLLAPAKVNLYLRVIGRRTDGYHDLLSLIQMVGLYDRVHFSEASDGIRLEVAGNRLPSDASNLVYRAAGLIQQEIRAEKRPEKGVFIRLDKTVPIAAGLGGGSSDAAATLIGLNRLWSLGWSRERLEALGACLGCDIPFFFHGPTAWVSGRGEIVQPVGPVFAGWILIVHPDIAVSTASVYERYDRGIGLTNAEQGPNITRSDRDRPPVDVLLSRPVNDLEGITCSDHPELEKIKTRLRDLGAEGVMMSGSGPSIFGFYKNETLAKKSVEVFEKIGQYRVFLAAVLRRSPI